MDDKDWQEKHRQWLETVPKNLRDAHAHCRNNKAEILKSNICGCFYCLAIYNSVDITKWIPETRDGEGVTAQCPRCGIDSVLGSAAGFPITEKFLTEMKSQWFDR